jgi:hypothetical protein
MSMPGLPLAIALALALGAPPPAPVPWGPNERMELEIDYLGITMGRAQISVGPSRDGVTPVQLSSRSAGLAAIVTFRQTLVSELDDATLLPRASVLDALEPGDYRHTDTARFDRAAGQATVREKGRFDHTYLIEVPARTIDFMALVFTLRTLPLPDGATHAFQVLAGRKVSAVVATVVKREQVTTDAATFSTVKVRIPTGFDGKFSEKNPTYVWFSDDPRRVVVKISADFAIGRASARLTRYQPGDHEGVAPAPPLPESSPTDSPSR